MRRATKVGLAVSAAVLAVFAIAIAGWVRHGFSARDRPSAIEAVIAGQLRHLAAPRNARSMKNPVRDTPEIIAEARAHFADHCALCHGNDGRGRTEIGRNLYPKSPDMSSGHTQSLSDGEIFSIIKNGVRLTGMPAWGSDTAGDDWESWKLVRFIRHLPKITPAELKEMEGMNPMNPAEMKEVEEENKFLEEGEETSRKTPSPKHERH
jgi:mono/diheme cytochrome c family protein